MFLSVAFFAIFFVFGNLDYSTVFSVAPFINETVITIIGLLLLFAAIGKSAQIGLHTWLPDAMEGQLNKIIIILSIIIVVGRRSRPNNDVLTSSNEYFLNVSFQMIGVPIIVLGGVTGCMLGDGHIQKQSNKGNARYGMTMKYSSKEYMKILINTVFSEFFPGKLIPYPNPLLPQHLNKAIAHYSFTTRSMPFSFFLYLKKTRTTQTMVYLR